MEFHFPPGQNYDCVQCGRSCQGNLQVRADPFFEKEMRKSPLAESYTKETGLRPIHRGEEGFRVLRRQDEQCIFLDQDNLCKVHAEHGSEAKPLACRLFPFSVTPTPDGYFVRLSFYCTAVKANHGRQAIEHRKDLESLLERIEFKKVGFEPIHLAGGTYFDWPAYKAFESWLQGLFDGRDFKQAMAFGLTAASELMSTSGTITLQRMQELIAAGPQDRVSQDPFVTSTLNYGTVACIARIAARNFDECQEITDALWEGGMLRFQHWAWTGTTAQVMQVAGKTASTPLLVRYLDSLLFGKQLAEGRSVFSNLLVFYRLPDWIVFYAALSCLERGEEVPDDTDLERALDFLEQNFLTHGRRLEDLHEVIADSVLQQVLYQDLESQETGDESQPHLGQES